MPPGFSVRPPLARDIPALCGLEQRAAQAFADHGYPALAAEPESTPTAFEARFSGFTLRIVADDRDLPAGFVATLAVGGWLWIAELSVDPVHGRKGLATALLDHLEAESRSLGLAGLALSTFRDVPFNAPFYRRRGFVDVDVRCAAPELADRWRVEVPEGVSASERVLMLRARDGLHET